MKEIILEKNNRLETVPAEYVASLTALQQKHLRKVIEAMNTLDISDSKFVTSSDNLRKLVQVANGLRDVVVDSEFIEILTTFASQMSVQASVNNRYFQAILKDFEVIDLYTDILRQSKTNAVNTLLDGVDSEFVKPIKDTLERAIVNNSNYTDTLKDIETIVVGNDQVNPKLKTYSETYARQTFAVSDRSYTAAVANELGMDWFWYSGGEWADSRPFCIERNDAYYHRKEIELWGGGTPTPGFSWPQGGTWKGRIDGTNASTIFTLLGGWNCQHSVMPTSEIVVPEADKKRAKDLGYT